jgi:hypothetical protein
MSPYRTFAGNGRGTNRPNTGIEASKTVGEASILHQVVGAFLPHPTLRRVSGSKTSACTLLSDNPLRVGGSPQPIEPLEVSIGPASVKKNVNRRRSCKESQCRILEAEEEALGR